MELVLEVKSRNASTIGWFAAICCVAGAAFILVSGKYNPMIGWGLLGAALLIPLPFLVGAHVQRRLIINDQGIEDSRLGVGVIPWSEIESAALESKYNNIFLCLKLKDAEKFLARMPHEKRLRYEKHFSLGFKTFNVSISGVDVDPIDMLSFVRERAKRA
ncbi:MAG TPA: STM3941 family protein [Bdellovibrionales bacterium]|nr:STM3941 family protein [Bdellovibrionales bacterium]